jgi:Flp pilus assembly protein TadD
MILPLLIAASVSAAPAAPAPDAHELLAGARHAVRVNRLDQASVMISRALEAGATGPELDRVLADLAFASDKYAEAIGRYEALLKISPGDPSLIEPAAIAALKLGQVDRASALLSSTSRTGTWRLWNARGVVADLKRDWGTADASYERAIALAPSAVGPINNRGWSLVLRGEWKQALSFFERAIEIDPKSERIADNLELARMALAAELPRREPGESESSWAARLNDAGIAAVIMGDKSRATAAFTQAIGVSGTWYARAANNLEALGSR